MGYSKDYGTTYSENEIDIMNGTLKILLGECGVFSMQIRKMQINDYEQIYTLWLSCKGMGLNNIDDSQDGILQTIIMDIVYEGAARAEHILKDTSVPLLNRIVMAIMAQAAAEFEGAHKLAEELHKVDNAKLEQQYRKTMLKKITSVLEGAVKEAQEQDTIHTNFPKECIESLLLMGHMMFDCDTFGWKEEEYPVKVQAFLCNAERIFGTKEGEFQGFMEMF